MGIVRMGPPEELLLLLKRDLNVSTFVETGTFNGGTAAWASNHFKKVITIENSKIYFDEAKNTYKHLQNIDFLFGDSRSVLKNTVAQIPKPAIFWLDAHWCSMDSYGYNDQCPIIEEVQLVGSTGIKHCIFIDDARLFLSPPHPGPVCRLDQVGVDQNAAQTLDAESFNEPHPAHVGRQVIDLRRALDRLSAVIFLRQVE